MQESTKRGAPYGGEGGREYWGRGRIGVNSKDGRGSRNERVSSRLQSGNVVGVAYAIWFCLVMDVVVVVVVVNQMDGGQGNVERRRSLHDW